MATLIRLTAYAIAVCLLGNGFLYCLYPLSSPQKALVRRILLITFLEFAILCGVKLIWSHVTALLKKINVESTGSDHIIATPNKNGQRNTSATSTNILEEKPSGYHRRSVVTLLKYFIAGWLILSQLSFVLNIVLVLLHNENNWMGYLSYVNLGFFVHCIIGLLLQIGLRLCLVACRAGKQSLYRNTKSKNRKEHVQVWDTAKWLYGDSSVQAVRVVIALLYAAVIGTYGLYQAHKPPRIRSVEVNIPGLAKYFDGFSIIQLSDIHLGPTVLKEKLLNVVDIVNTFHADAIVIVGDLSDGSVEALGDSAKHLGDLKSKQGTYFVTGNHEYFTGLVDNWFEFLSQHGVKPLHNEHVRIQASEDSEASFYLAGVDDIFASKIRYEGHGMDLDKAVGECDPKYPIVLLAHQPWAAKQALDSGKYNIRLVLSGHTHGGQMFPLMVFAYLYNPFFLGLYHYRDSAVYVSSGTAYWGIPMRIGTEMEITQIVLRSTTKV